MSNQSGIPKELLEKLPKDVQEKLKQIKKDLDKFTKKALEKYDKEILGIALLPPPKPEPGKKPEEKIDVLVLADDSETKMPVFEFKSKLLKDLVDIAKNINEKIIVELLPLSELWQNCYDGKYELLKLIALSAPLHDKGMLSAIKIAEVHKNMVLKKFEKYIVSYVLAGSIVQGKATPTSDIDTWVVIDDTDVKKMTRAELKDKLRAIIIGMAIEAGELTGIRNKLNIQVYILTDFWESLKEANPVIFTLLRDGVPFYDRGIFMPWKLLLKMGRIKPSPEAIDTFMSSGETILKKAKAKLTEIGLEDLFWATITPSQAALMLYGLPPPTPRETPEIMKEIFVKKEKLLEENYVKILEKILQVRKDIEHGRRKEISGKELDELLSGAERFLKRIKRLFAQIEKAKQEESIQNIYETIISAIRDILVLEGIEKAIPEDKIKEFFKKELIDKGKIPEKYNRMLASIIKAKKDFEEGKLTKQEIDKARRESSELLRYLIEYVQRKRARELEKARLRIKYGNRFGEVILLEDKAYVIRDIDAKEKEINKARIKEDGSLGPLEKATEEELEHDLATIKLPKKALIKEATFESLKRIFGKDLEIVLG
ncbi:hypothetical protein DRJ19_01420 [Candidatus Woesearchaeota archaeon]|nr:MAG: hypothetical protein DRJ19_01420 [Candidatus Woesearchaeota archaeon]